MTWYAVLVTERGSNDTTAYGPYRSLGKAREIKARFHDSASVDYFDSEEYVVDVVAMRVPAT